jgi:hypothetical protein
MAENEAHSPKMLYIRRNPPVLDREPLKKLHYRRIMLFMMGRQASIGFFLTFQAACQADDKWYQ